MDRGTPTSISPIFVVLVGVMSAALVLALYHCIAVTWCAAPRTRARADAALRTRDGSELSSAQLVPPARTYGKGEGMVSSADQSTCAVCLSDFKDGEAVRLLPECLHCFHVPCIDTWLRSHSNCPMCRTQTLTVSSPNL